VARTAITQLHPTPIMFELGARPHAPRELYRAYLAQSEVFVGIYWQQYGWVAPGEEVSGLEDEYLLSGDKPKLIYMKAAAERQPRRTEMLARVEADDRASYKRFDNADDLAELLADDMAVLLTERFARPVPAAAPGRRPAPVPAPLTPIVGREDEIAAVVALLRDPDVHLVTLIGPGGIGKTRLAIEVARKMSTAEPADLDGVSFIDLAAVRDAAGWTEAVTAVLGIRPEGTRPVLEILIDRLLLLGARGISMVMIGRAAEAEPLLRRTLETATSLSNRRLAAYALLGLGGALVRPAVGEACQRLDDAAGAFRELGDRWGLALTLSTRGQLALLAGDHAAARAMHEEALAAAQAIDNHYLQAQVLDMIGLDAATVGDMAAARDRYAAAADLHIGLLDYEGSAYGLSGFAGLALVQGRAAAAARLIGASGYARQVVGTTIWPGMQSTTDDLAAAVASALGPAAFAAATAVGARMRLPDALRYGLAATAEQTTSDPFPDWVSRLRPAEPAAAGRPGL
jgi:tetratricopeptide (TPR) repeat protein